MSEIRSKLTLPTDVVACHALIEQMACTVEELQQESEKLQAERDALRLRLAEVLQQAFAKRRERYVENPDQMIFDFGDSDDVADAASGLAEAVEESGQKEESPPKDKAPKKRRQRRTTEEQFPVHIPRYTVDVEPSDEVKTCGQHGERKLIGYDSTETIEKEKIKCRVRVTRYPKYVCEGCEACGVSSPPRQPGLTAGNRYDTSIAAEIITGKYGYHLPIYRQQDYFAGSGWLPSRSTLLNILSASATLLMPLVQYFRSTLLDGDRIGTDDTRVTLLLPRHIPQPIAGDVKATRIHEVLSEAKSKDKSSLTARMWAYRSLTVPLNVFDFTVSRHRDGPDLFLDGFEGTLMADCYSGYQQIEMHSAGKIKRAACVAHARRKVFDAREGYPLESAQLLAWFQQLYDLEDRARTMSVQEREQLRQSGAAPVWKAIGEWLDSEPAHKLLPKSKLAEATGYLRNHWEAMRVYLEDGRLPIDNNEVEQLMKQVAIGRKNWLFVGSIAAGERAAALMSIVSSAIRNDLDVWEHVKDVLDQLLAGSTDYHSMRPDIWKQSHPEAIREYRTEERRDRADRKQKRRAKRRKKK